MLVPYVRYSNNFKPIFEFISKNMTNKRAVYAAVVIITVVSGLLARYKKELFPDIVNLYLGDILYAFMMYYIVSFIVVSKGIIRKGMIALIICFAIELLQLYQAEWINAIRQTLPGRLILGSGFLWSDLLAYTIGVGTALLFDKLILLSKGKATGNVT